MSRQPHPDQLAMFWRCDVCGDLACARTACGAALGRWFRRENRDAWVNEPNRAVW